MFNRVRFYSVLFLIAANPLSTVVASDYTDLMGPTFVEPTPYVSPQFDRNWQQRPIRYEEKHAGADMVVDIDQYMYPILKPFVAEFAKKEGLKIAYLEGTCGLSAGALKKKSIDIGGFCCPPGKTDHLPGLRFHTLGVLPIGFLVRKDNPVDNLSLEELRGIYSGDIDDWSQTTDGAAKQFHGRIHVVTRMHCKARPGHWRLLLEENNMSPLVDDVGALPDVMRQVLADRYAIGYNPQDHVRRNDPEQSLKMLKIDGIAIDAPGAITEKRYPVYQVLSITSWQQQSGTHAEKLVHYLMQKVNELPQKYQITPYPQLKASGWQFSGDELTGEPRAYR